MPASPALRLAIDIGGTFTDSVLVSAQGDILASNKTLTTHHNPADAALEGAARAMAQCSRSLGEVATFIHGTTLATNALIERRGARVATITSEGFRDILEIAYERRYAQYDINIEKPDFLVPRERSFTLRERISAQGGVLLEMTDDSIAALIGQLDACKAESVAICLLHAYANPAHEQRLRDVLRAQRPHLHISISSEVSPEAREFDRLCTTVANSYVQPLLSSCLTRFAESFAAEGIRCPILMMTAAGGICTIETAARFPVRLVESGPAGGAMLAARLAKRAGLKKVLSFDMGGTTAKLCLLDNARPQTSRRFEIARAERFIKGSGMPVRIPVIEMIEIGAGGGSIASVDHLGRLRAGPQSAGSEPGPVAFGRGGTQPTVTDADITLGYIPPDNFAEGRIRIDAQAAENALEHNIGAPLGISATAAADGISRIVDESMASAGRMHAAESGKHLGERAMIAFGGNGPLHASRVARSAGIKRIIIPPNPGVGSAVGFLFAPLSFEIVRTRYALLKSLDAATINAMFEEMLAEAKAVVAQGLGDDAGDAPLQTARTAFMRYSGQGHEIDVLLPNHPLTDADTAPLQAAFEGEYRKRFSRPIPAMEIEILNWGVRVAAISDADDESIGETGDAAGETTARPPAEALVHGVDDVGGAARQSRSIVCDVDGSIKQAACIPRGSLKPGARIPGPALITEAQTTTLVSADFSACADAMGNLILTREGQPIRPPQHSAPDARREAA